MKELLYIQYFIHLIIHFKFYFIIASLIIVLFFIAAILEISIRRSRPWSISSVQCDFTFLSFFPFFCQLGYCYKMRIIKDVTRACAAAYL